MGQRRAWAERARVDPLDARDEPVEHGAGCRPLQREQRHLVALVEHRAVEAAGTRAQLLDHGPPVAGIRHDEVAIRAGAVAHHIVDDAAVLVHEQAVLGPTLGERRELGDERHVECGAGLRAEHDDLGHMREIEQTRSRAHRVMLGEFGGESQRHRPAGELRELRPRGSVRVVQRTAAPVARVLSPRPVGRSWISHGDPLDRGIQRRSRRPIVTLATGAVTADAAHSSGSHSGCGVTVEDVEWVIVGAVTVVATVLWRWDAARLRRSGTATPHRPRETPPHD